MGLITTTLPTIGDPNSTEDVDVRAALAAIIAVVNGNIDTTNIATNGVASSDITAAAVTKAKLGSDALSAFLQLGASLLGVRAEFGLDTVSYGGGGTSVGRSASYTALSAVPKFAAALPMAAPSGATPLIAKISSATTTLLSFDIVASSVTVLPAGTYNTYWMVIG